MPHPLWRMSVKRAKPKGCPGKRFAFFQAADVYQVPVMRQGIGPDRPGRGGWTLVFAMFAVLRSITGIGGALTDTWIGAWYALSLTGLLPVTARGLRLVRRWMTVRTIGTARHHRRRRNGGSRADPRPGSPGGQRHPHLRHLRRPLQRPLAAGRCRLSEARQHQRPGRVRPPGPHRHADRLHSAARGKAGSGTPEASSGILPVDIRLSAHTDKVRFRNRGTVLHRHRTVSSTWSKSRSPTGTWSQSGSSTGFRQPRASSRSSH
jgi:hypothetical protein